MPAECGEPQGPVAFSGVNGALICSDLICVALTEAGAGSSRYREAQVGNHERGCGFPSPPFLPSCLRGGRARGSKEVRRAVGEVIHKHGRELPGSQGKRERNWENWRWDKKVVESYNPDIIRCCPSLPLQER